jgi:hypothetical protein
MNSIRAEKRRKGCPGLQKALVIADVQQQIHDWVPVTNQMPAKDIKKRFRVFHGCLP